MAISTEAAETLALQALTWLVANDELLPIFLGSTGASASDLRVRAEDAEFLASVLDFLMLDDDWVVAFCDACAVPYDLAQQARAMLPGGDEMHWT